MTPRPSARASTCVGYSSNCSGSSGSDHIRADRIASLLARTAHPDCQPFWQFAVPGSAEVTSPAGIARRPDGTTPLRASPRIRHLPNFVLAQREQRSRVVMQKICCQLTPARRTLSDAIDRCPCRRFQIWFFDGMSEDTGDRSPQQAVKRGIAFARQASCQLAPSVRHCARYGLVVQLSGSPTRRAAGLRGALCPKQCQRLLQSTIGHYNRGERPPPIALVTDRDGFDVLAAQTRSIENGTNAPPGTLNLHHGINTRLASSSGARNLGPPHEPSNQVTRNHSIGAYAGAPEWCASDKLRDLPVNLKVSRSGASRASTPTLSARWVTIR